jgi:hypothetical protein
LHQLLLLLQEQKGQLHPQHQLLMMVAALQLPPLLLLLQGAQVPPLPACTVVTRHSRQVISSQSKGPGTHIAHTRSRTICSSADC